MYPPVPQTVTVQTGNSPYPREVIKRAAGLKALCICELLFALWTMILGDQFWVFILYIPVDIIGFYAAQRMRKLPLTVFSFSKALLLGLFLLFFADLIAKWASCGSYCGSGHGEIPILAVMMVLILAFQLVCLYLAAKLRQDLLLAERTSAPGVELNAVEIPPPSMPTQPSQQMQPMHHFQDPHAAAPGYPYPPQYYPMPYMNQAPQGYPQMPYAPYPHQPAPTSPVSTYPSFTIGDEQQPQQQQHRNPDTQPLL